VDMKDVRLQGLDEIAECASTHDGRPAIVRGDEVVVDAVTGQSCRRSASLNYCYARSALRGRFRHIDQRRPVFEQSIRPASLRVEEETDLGDVWHATFHDGISKTRNAGIAEANELAGKIQFPWAIVAFVPVTPRCQRAQHLLAPRRGANVGDRRESATEHCREVEYPLVQSPAQPRGILVTPVIDPCRFGPSVRRRGINNRSALHVAKRCR
jgi:hypothetical protein